MRQGFLPLKIFETEILSSILFWMWSLLEIRPTGVLKFLLQLYISSIWPLIASDEPFGQQTDLKKR